MDKAKLYRLYSRDDSKVYIHTVAAMTKEAAKQKYREAHPGRVVDVAQEWKDVHSGIILEHSEDKVW